MCEVHNLFQALDRSLRGRDDVYRLHISHRLPSNFEIVHLQGYLAHQKQRPPMPPNFGIVHLQGYFAHKKYCRP